MTGVAVRSRVRCRASRPAPGKQPPVPRTKDTGPPLQQPSHPCGPGTALSHDPRSRDPPSSPRKPPGNGPHASRRPLPSLARSTRLRRNGGVPPFRPLAQPVRALPARAMHGAAPVARSVLPQAQGSALASGCASVPPIHGPRPNEKGAAAAAPFPFMRSRSSGPHRPRRSAPCCHRALRRPAAFRPAGPASTAARPASTDERHRPGRSRPVPASAWPRR